MTWPGLDPQMSTHPGTGDSDSAGYGYGGDPDRLNRGGYGTKPPVDVGDGDEFDVDPITGQPFNKFPPTYDPPPGAVGAPSKDELLEAIYRTGMGRSIGSTWGGLFGKSQIIDEATGGSGGILPGGE